jgi:hypothetical protein
VLTTNALSVLRAHYPRAGRDARVIPVDAVARAATPVVSAHALPAGAIAAPHAAAFYTVLTGNKFQISFSGNQAKKTDGQHSIVLQTFKKPEAVFRLRVYQKGKNGPLLLRRGAFFPSVCLSVWH